MDSYQAALTAAGLKEGPPLRPETLFRPRVGHKRDGDTLAADKHSRIYYPTVPTMKELSALGAPPTVEVTPMPLPSKPALTLDEKRQRLEDREARWRALSPVAICSMRVEGPFHKDWDVLTGGVLYVTAGFLVGPEGDETPMHEYNKKDRTQVPSFAVPLPSATNPDLRTPPLAGWSIIPPYIPYRSCRTAIDPAQNLLASPAALTIATDIFGQDSMESEGFSIEITSKRIGTFARSSNMKKAHGFTVEMLDLCTLKAPEAMGEPESFRGNHLMFPLQPSLHQLPQGDESAATCSDVRICGSTVATLVHHGSGPYVPVLHLNYSSTMQGNFGCLIGHLTSTAGTAFELLDERTVIVVNPGYKGLPINPSLAIWTFPEDECDTPARGMLPNGHPGVLLAELDLPATSKQVTQAWITPQRAPHTTRATGGSPWAPDNERGLLRVSLSFDEERYDLYVLREMLLALAQEGKNRIAGGFRAPFKPSASARRRAPDSRCAVDYCECHGAVGGMRLALPQQAERFETEDEEGRTFWANDVDLVARQYEWEAWGPENSRLVLADAGVSDKYSVSLYRDVRLVMEEGKPVGYEVLDFSPASVDRNTQRDTAPEGVERTMSDSTTVPAGVWKGDVETRLPYVCIRRRGAIPGLADGEFSIMSDEQRIVLSVQSKLDTEGMGKYRRDHIVMCM